MKNWYFCEKGKYNYEKPCEPKMGYIYIVKIYVMPKFFLTKIGATTMPAQRFSNLGRNTRICCISKPHYNYFENEMILHEYFKKYRIPKSLNSKSDVQPELFNISLVDIFKSMPTLNFETNIDNCIPNYYANNKAIWYSTK